MRASYGDTWALRAMKATWAKEYMLVRCGITLMSHNTLLDGTIALRQCVDNSGWLRLNFLQVKEGPVQNEEAAETMEEDTRVQLLVKRPRLV
jgi:hypothetical protein